MTVEHEIPLLVQGVLLAHRIGVMERENKLVDRTGPVGRRPDTPERASRARSSWIWAFR